MTWRARAHRLLALAFLVALVPQLADARIPRDRAQVRAFRAENPCPATGMVRGACPGWAVDHIEALCAGGRDHPENMQWISKADHRFKTLVDERECRKSRTQRRKEYQPE